MTRHSDRVARFGLDVDDLFALASDGFLDRLQLAEREWQARGFPSGGGDAIRSADETSSTERAAMARDKVGQRLAAIEDDITMLSVVARRLVGHAAWLRPIDSETARKLVGGADQCRVGACADDADPGHAGFCSACHEYVRRNGSEPTAEVLERRWQVRVERTA